jgi:4-diphosphocytidyl-2-C-methyl-D-erythritol kinase
MAAGKGPSLQQSAPAKLNLTLSVGPPRSDGMHPLASWMVALELADRLTLSVATDGRTRVCVQRAGEAPYPFACDWPPETDLVRRAHAALERAAGQALPTRIVARKIIPPGAGLGGGSSDAASVLAALPALHGLDPRTLPLEALARELGSDVPFLLRAARGEGSFLVSGTGDRLEPLPAPEGALVLILPARAIATGAVYRAFDARPAAPQDACVSGAARSRALAALSRPWALWNDLAPAVMRVAPDLAVLRQHAAALLGRAVHVTGSGAAMFALAEGAAEAETMAERVERRLGVPARATAIRKQVP